MNAKFVRVFSKLILFIGIKCVNLVIKFWYFRDEYHQNPLDYLMKLSSSAFFCAYNELDCAFNKFFEDDSVALNQGNWTKEVQKALTIPPSSKGDEKEKEQTPAFNLLCLKAAKWNKCLSDIRKL